MKSRKQAPCGSQPPARPRLLLVDDDRAYRDLLARQLEGRGYRVHSARDGIEALTVFRERGADVLLLDVKMPDIDGLEIFHAVRVHSEAPILFLSGVTGGPIRACLDQLVRTTSNVCLLTKPAGTHAIMDMIDQLYRGRSAAS